MILLKAIHEIVSGLGDSRRTFSPGKEFQATADDAKYLLGIGAAVQIGKAPAATQGLVDPKPENNSTDDTGATDDEPENSGTIDGDDLSDLEDGSYVYDEDLETLTVKQLMAMADAREILIEKGAKKADIIAAIRAHDEDDLID